MPSKLVGEGIPDTGILFLVLGGKEMQVST